MAWFHSEQHAFVLAFIEHELTAHLASVFRVLQSRTVVMMLWRQCYAGGRILSCSPPVRCQQHISLLVINEKVSRHCQIVPRGHIAFS